MCEFIKRPNTNIWNKLKQYLLLVIFLSTHLFVYGQFRILEDGRVKNVRTLFGKRRYSTNNEDTNNIVRSYTKLHGISARGYFHLVGSTIFNWYNNDWSDVKPGAYYIFDSKFRVEPEYFACFSFWTDSLYARNTADNSIVKFKLYNKDKHWISYAYYRNIRSEYIGKKYMFKRKELNSYSYHECGPYDYKTDMKRQNLTHGSLWTCVDFAFKLEEDEYNKRIPFVIILENSKKDRVYFYIQDKDGRLVRNYESDDLHDESLTSICDFLYETEELQRYNESKRNKRYVKPPKTIKNKSKVVEVRLSNSANQSVGWSLIPIGKHTGQHGSIPANINTPNYVIKVDKGKYKVTGSYYYEKSPNKCVKTSTIVNIDDDGGFSFKFHDGHASIYTQYERP